MEKLQAVLDLMQKICDTSFSIDDLDDLTIDVAAKQCLVDTFDNARCTKELDRMKQLIKKVEKGETLFQGGNQ